VVCAAAIAYGAGHLDSIGQLSLAILGTVGVYWIAHLHAVTIGVSLTHRHRPSAALRHAFIETLPLLGVSVVPLAVLLAATLVGTDLRHAAWAALVATIGLLAVYSFVGARRAGLDLPGQLAEAAAGAGIGVLVAFLKVALH
jgi:hypothetical protein